MASPSAPYWKTVYYMGQAVSRRLVYPDLEVMIKQLEEITGAR
jgi:hypothetical protein